MDANIENALIEKITVSPGKSYVPLKPGTRVKFHFLTKKLDGTVLDDSRAMGNPMELVLGKKFKLEVWEAIVQKMALNEVAKFKVNKKVCWVETPIEWQAIHESHKKLLPLLQYYKSLRMIISMSVQQNDSSITPIKLVAQYPFISKTLRGVGKKVEEKRHCCGMTLQNEGLGYKDLDDLLAAPCDLEFTIDLFSIEMPEDYKKDNWQLSDAERFQTALKLKEEGNELYKQQNFAQAEECYRQAVGMLEQLMMIEKPHDVEWLELAKHKVPLLLNYAQCRLLAHDYYSVIEHCSDVLKLDADNVKALFRRAKAHFGAWNPQEAREDFRRAAELDPSLQTAVSKELRAIDKAQYERDVEDKRRLQSLF